MGIKRILRALRGSDADFRIPKLKRYFNRYMSILKSPDYGRIK